MAVPNAGFMTKSRQADSLETGISSCPVHIASLSMGLPTTFNTVFELSKKSPWVSGDWWDLKGREQNTLKLFNPWSWGSTLTPWQFKHCFNIYHLSPVLTFHCSELMRCAFRTLLGIRSVKKLLKIQLGLKPGKRTLKWIKLSKTAICRRWMRGA